MFISTCLLSAADPIPCACAHCGKRRYSPGMAGLFVCGLEENIQVLNTTDRPRGPARGFSGDYLAGLIFLPNRAAMRRRKALSLINPSASFWL